MLDATIEIQLCWPLLLFLGIPSLKGQARCILATLSCGEDRNIPVHKLKHLGFRTAAVHFCLLKPERIRRRFAPSCLVCRGRAFEFRLPNVGLMCICRNSLLSDAPICSNY